MPRHRLEPLELIDLRTHNHNGESTTALIRGIRLSHSLPAKEEATVHVHGTANARVREHRRTGGGHKPKPLKLANLTVPDLLRLGVSVRVPPGSGAGFSTEVIGDQRGDKGRVVAIERG